MSWVTGILVYVVLWWLILFVVLPIGVRSHDETEQEVVPGTHSSAPTRPLLLRKALATTLLAGVLWLAFYLATRYGLVSFRPD